MTQVEWHGRSDFAEFAEALGVRSDEIMAAQTEGRKDGLILVIYSIGTDDPERAVVWTALLDRDDDDVLVIQSRRYVSTLRGFMRKFGVDELEIE